MKKPGIIIVIVGIFLLLIIGFVIYLFLGTGQSILPIETKSVDWQGIPTTISASGFGTNINDRSFPFCGSNDADVTARNNYNVNDILSLSSSLSTARQTCGTNEIYAEFEIPSGKLTGDCVLKASESNNDKSVSTCKIISESSTLYTKSAVWDMDCNRGQSNLNAEFWNGNCRPSVSNSFDLTFNKPTKIKVEITTKTGNTGSASATINLDFEVIEISEPTPPTPNGWDKFKSLILNLIQNLINLFKSQSIIGQVLVAPGSIQTYNIDLTAPAPDSDYSDGYYEVQYANWILSDEDGNMIQKGTWEKTNGIYKKSITITVPDVEDKNYMIASIITQINGTYDYNTGQWTWTEEVPIVQEGIDIKTKYSISPPVDPPPSGWSKFWTAFKDFFCKLLPFLCS